MVYEVTSKYALILQVRPEDLFKILKDEPSENCLECFRSLEEARSQYIQSLQFLKQLENIGGIGNNRQGNIRSRHRQGFIKTRAVALLGKPNPGPGDASPTQLHDPSNLAAKSNFSLRSMSNADSLGELSESPTRLSTEIYKPPSYIDALMALRRSYSEDPSLVQQSGSFSDLSLSVSQVAGQFKEEEDYPTNAPPVKNVLHQTDDDYFKKDRGNKYEEEALNKSADEIELVKFHEIDPPTVENNTGDSRERSLQPTSASLNSEIQAIEVSFF